MKTKITKEELRDLILSGITTEELNSRYDYSHITDTYGMFWNCSKLESVPNFDTRNIKDMGYMFDGCSNLKSVPNFDTMNVQNMSYIFYGCSQLKDIDPYNFPGYDFSRLDIQYMKEKYPEFYI